MGDPFTTVMAFCGLHPAAIQGGLLAGLAVAGLAGSAMHCGPMCGPFVLGQVADRMARLPAHRLRESCRLTQGLLLPYHLGRLTTYAALGAVAAGVGQALAAVPWLSDIRMLLLLGAAALFLAHALGRLAPGAGGAAAGGATAGRWLRRLVGGLDRGSARDTYLLGAALGFLPCGFLYAALAAAAGAAGAVQGALAMLAFGLGTVPLLAALGVAGRAGLRPHGRLSGRLAPAVLAVNAAMLALAALAV